MLSSPLKGNDGIGSSLLRSVADALAEEWATRAGDFLHAPDEVARIVEELVDAVETYAREDEPEIVVGEVSDRYLYHRLAQEMRGRLLELWREGRPTFSDSEAAEVLEIAYCLEQIRMELWPRGDEDLAFRLSGPDTFELLVEVAHDMRSPLSSILFLSETLRGGRSGEINDLQKRQLGLIYSAALGLMSITNDVVDAAKRGGGFLDEEPSPFSLGEVFDSIQELVRPVAEEKELDLTFGRPDRDYVQGHQMALNRILLNLVTNALKFTEEGGVTVKAERVDRSVMEISVADTGRGMDEEQLNSLFRPFQKSDYRSGHFFSNSGLGLSIARRLLTSMDSELEVESEVGEGTRFSFRIELPTVTSP